MPTPHTVALPALPVLTAPGRAAVGCSSGRFCRRWPSGWCPRPSGCGWSRALDDAAVRLDVHNTLGGRDATEGAVHADDFAACPSVRTRFLRSRIRHGVLVARHYPMPAVGRWGREGLAKGRWGFILRLARKTQRVATGRRSHRICLLLWTRQVAARFRGHSLKQEDTAPHAHGGRSDILN